MASVKKTSKNVAALLRSCPVQVRPPSSVTRMVPESSDRSAVLCVDKVNGVQNRVRSAGLISPVQSSIFCAKNRPSRANHPTRRGVEEKDTIERGLGSTRLRRPCLSAIFGIKDSAVRPYHPAALLVGKEHSGQQCLGSAQNRLPAFASIHGSQNASTGANRPACARIEEMHAQERGLGSGLLKSRSGRKALLQRIPRPALRYEPALRRRKPP